MPDLEACGGLVKVVLAHFVEGASTTMIKSPKVSFE